MIPYYNPMLQNQANYEQSLRNIIEQANGQLQQIQSQPQPTNLTQNFQLSPISSQGNLRFVNSLEEVQKEVVIADTYFLAKNNSQMWIKNTRGEIRIFNLHEIVPKDEKDLMIEDLQRQINELKGGMLNESKSNGNELYEQPINDTVGAETPESESSTISDIPTSKTTKRKS